MNSEDHFKKVEKLYDNRIESTHDSVKATGGWESEQYVSSICEEIYKKIGISKNDRVLELGCGSGVLGNWIKKRCDYYVGIDISFKMLDFFLKTDSDQKTNLLQGNTDSIPLSNHTFDVIILNGVTMYFPDDITLEKTLQEMKRISKPNGIIFIGENISLSSYPWELTWFQDLTGFTQTLAKPYIKIRKWIAMKIPKLAGKWKSVHKEISPIFIRKYFDGSGEVIQSKAASYTIKKKIQGKKYKGNRRIDFLIRLNRG